MAVGMIAGVVYGATRECAELACLMKPVGVVIMGMGGMVAGAVIGGAIGWIASGRPDHPLGQYVPFHQRRVGITIGF